MKSLLVLFYFIFITAIASNSRDWFDSDHPITDSEYQVYNEDIEALESLLFLNRTKDPSAYAWEQFRRRLGITKVPYTAPVPCTRCSGLKYCAALNSFMVQEVYYPNNPALRETCTVLESLGSRIASTIFGLGRTFRDTPDCRTMVMQYLCLYWGTNNDMYTNYCVNQEQVLPSGEVIAAARPPCKSFCVQIANVCAFDADYFIQSCDNIACPPTRDQCTPDPSLKGIVLAANLGCDVPYYSSPYFRRGAAAKTSSLHPWISAMLIASIFISCYYSIF